MTQMRIFAIGKTTDKRIIERRNSGEDILDYDIDNSYPQRMKAYALQSGELMKSLRAFSRFVIGKGFRDKTFYKTKINSKGQTIDQLLKAIIEQDYRFFEGFALHIRYNMNYKAVEVRRMPFEWCRIGKLDDFGDSTKVAVYEDWDKSLYKRKQTNKIVYYDKFNPDPEIIALQAERAGGFQNWRGQILYYTPSPDEYPLATFDPIINPVITDYEITNYDFRQVASGFSPKLAYMHPTKFEENEREEKIEELQEFEGPEGGNIIIVENAQEGHEYFKEIQQDNTDSRYKQTEENTKNKIRSFFAIPPIIVGEEMSSGLGNSQIIQNSFDLYNSQTEPDRIVIEEIFRKVFSLWKENINPSQDYSLIPLSWGQTQTNNTQTQVQ